MTSLNQLRFFREVARQNSFSKAAEICCVTQPTLSNSISLLEEELDGKLFIRSTRKVSLSAFGQHMLSLAEAVLTAQEEFVSGVKAFKNPDHRLLRIGLTPLVDARLLSEVLTPFRKQHPGVEVFFKECFMDDLDQRLGEGTVDLAITPRRETDIRFDSIPFYREPLYFLPCKSDGEDIGVQNSLSVSLHDIVQETLILTMDGCGLRDTIKRMFRAEKLVITEYTGQAVSYNAVEDWAGLGIGAGLLPKSKISPANSTACQLLLGNNTPAMIDYEISFPRHGGQASHITEFITFLKEIAPRLIEGRAA